MRPKKLGLFSLYFLYWQIKTNAINKWSDILY